MLDDIRKRVEKASEGPWYEDTLAILARCEKHDGAYGHVDGGFYQVIADTGEIENCKADAIFIAHAREDIPYLLGLVDELVGTVEDLFNNDIILGECQCELGFLCGDCTRISDLRTILTKLKGGGDE